MQERVSLIILKAKFYQIKQELQRAEFSFNSCPNQEDAVFIEKYKPVLLELEQDINLLETFKLKDDENRK